MCGSPTTCHARQSSDVLGCKAYSLAGTVVSLSAERVSRSRTMSHDETGPAVAGPAFREVGDALTAAAVAERHQVRGRRYRPRGDPRGRTPRPASAAPRRAACRASAAGCCRARVRHPYWSATGLPVVGERVDRYGGPATGVHFAAEVRLVQLGDIGVDDSGRLQRSAADEAPAWRKVADLGIVGAILDHRIAVDSLQRLGPVGFFAPTCDHCGFQDRLDLLDSGVPRR